MKIVQRLITKIRFYPYLFFLNIPLDEAMRKCHGFEIIRYHYKNHTGILKNQPLISTPYLYNRITFIVDCKGMNIFEIRRQPENFIVVKMIVG